MKATEAIEVIGRIEYKPNFQLRVGNLISGDLSLVISMWVLHRDTGQHSPVMAEHLIEPEAFDEMRLVHFVHHQLRAMELHECDEFFKYRGVRIFDPHKKAETA